MVTIDKLGLQHNSPSVRQKQDLGLMSKHCYYNMCLFNVLGHAYHDLYVRIATPNLQQTSKLMYNKGGDKCMDL